MLMKDIPVFSALTRQMDWLGARQKVLAQNIANADTPGYSAKDLKPLTFEELVHKPQATMRTAKTNAGHIAPPGEADDTYARAKGENYESTPSANSVVLEEEILKVSDTRMSYDLAVSLYRKHMQMMKTAIGGRGG